MEGDLDIRIGFDGDSDGDDDSALAALYRWLARDDDLTGEVEISLVAADTEPEWQGSVFEVVNAVVTNALSLTSLIVAIRNSPPARRAEDEGGTLRIEARGVVVTVPPGSELSAEEIVALLRGGDGTAGQPEEP
ncbi:hypothetical protein ABZZ79_35530 [Streptomyces sp. NPDC006458]|uniref:effector-associated constant component EACC1 n=1 Tax=Streptomyces sp. NPDC006458 TaxID=3154302 RepID=UPI0033AF0FF7